MSALSWATAPLQAWHEDPHLGEGRHQHDWRVSAFWPSRPFRDARAVQVALRETLAVWQGRDLPPELWASEDLAAFLLRSMGAGNIVGVKVEREGFGGCGAGEWR